jgi:PAS domain S-box-containing protein
VPLRGSDDLVVVANRLGDVTYVSASYRRILGGTPMEPVGHPLRDLLGVDVDEGPVTLEVRHHDGTPRWLRGIVQPMRGGTGVHETLCVLADITTEVARDRALADSEELFRRAFSGAPTGIALSDFDGRLLRVNAAFADMLGHSVEELLLLSVEDITHPEDRRTDEVNLDEARSGDVTGHRVVKRYLHADGGVVPVEVHAATVHTADGQPYCIVAHVLPAQLAGRR